MHVPWRRVSSWHCDACGVCCKAYRVRLSAYEFLKLKNTGFVEEKAGRFFIKKINGCPFQQGRLCSLQQRLKPTACRLYPFIVRKKGCEEAIFEYHGEEYYIYVDVFCRNIKLRQSLGVSKSLIPLLEEAVKIYRGEWTGVELLTSRGINLSAHQTPLQVFHHREGRRRLHRQKLLL